MSQRGAGEIGVALERVRSQSEDWRRVERVARAARQDAEQICFGSQRGVDQPDRSARSPRSGTPASPPEFMVFRDVAQTAGAVASWMCEEIRRAELASGEIAGKVTDGVAWYESDLAYSEARMNGVASRVGAPR